MSEPTEPDREGSAAMMAAARARFEWLYEEPPYELVGRVVCEASAVEVGLLQCASQAGASTGTLGKKRARDLVKMLRRGVRVDPRITDGVLDKICECLDLRDQLAHGAPINLVTKPNVHGFAKGRRPEGEGFEWVGFRSEELESLAGDLRALSELLQAVALGLS